MIPMYSGDPDQSVHLHSLIRAFTVCQYVLYYPMILVIDKEGPDQTDNLQAYLSLHCLYK